MYGERIGGDLGAVGCERDGAFDGVFEFAYVAAPFATGEGIDGGGFDSDGLAGTPAEFSNEVIDELRDIFAAFAKGRHVDFHHG